MASELSERQPRSGLWPRVDRVFREMSGGGAGSWAPSADVDRREDAIVVGAGVHAIAPEAVAAGTEDGVLGVTIPPPQGEKPARVAIEPKAKGG